MGVNGEPCRGMQLTKSCIFTQIMWESVSILQIIWNLHQYFKSRKNPYEVLQDTRTLSENVKDFYDKIIITIVASLYSPRLLLLALVLVPLTHDNTHDYKLMTFSSIALYYGNTCTYIFFILQLSVYTVVLWNSTHGQSTLKVSQRGGWALFQVVLHLNKKSTHVMFTATPCPWSK